MKLRRIEVRRRSLAVLIATLSASASGTLLTTVDARASAVWDDAVSFLNYVAVPAFDAPVAMNAESALMHGANSKYPRRVANRGGARFIASGTIRNVASCADDGGIDTLRHVVGAAGSGDTVNLATVPLGCSKITLLAGELAVPQAQLYLVGPTDRSISIVNSQVGRIINHSGTGAFGLSYLTLSGGFVYTPGGVAKGGCILSTGNVYLNTSTISGCVAVSAAGAAYGGGIYSNSVVSTTSSTIVKNGAYTYNAGTARGGGIFAREGIVISSSAVTANFCATVAGSSMGGGAFVTGGPAGINSSTFNSNQADFGGAIYAQHLNGSLLMRTSTISGNKANVQGGAIWATYGGPNSTVGMQIERSTIAYNQALSVGGIYASESTSLSNSIVARNHSDTPFADLYIHGAGAALTGDHNVIVSSNLGLSGTLAGDPKLTRLANRGGQTFTLGLSVGSPASDAGSSNYAYMFDQRHFPREVPVGKPDIGAFERQANDDEIFFGGDD